MTFYVLDIDGSTGAANIFTQIDVCLPLVGSGPPTSIVAAGRAPALYLDADAGQIYVALEADGTVEGTRWIQSALSITNASTARAGIVQLAQASDVVTGTSTTLVITPAAASALARSGINDDITELLALNVPLTESQGGTNATSLLAAIKSKLPTTTGQANKFLSNDGSNYLWAIPGGLFINIVTSNTPNDQLVVNSYNHIKVANCTLLLPIAPNEGDQLSMRVDSFTNTVIQGDTIEGSSNPLTVDVANAMFSMIYTGATYGWEILRRS